MNIKKIYPGDSDIWYPLVMEYLKETEQTNNIEQPIDITVKAFLNSALKEPNFCMVGIENGHGPEAFVISNIMPKTPWFNMTKAWINAFYIKPDKRTGLYKNGLRLYLAFIKWLKDNQVDMIEFYTDKNSEKYEKIWDRIVGKAAGRVYRNHLSN